ncbi:hypothetical protein FPQ18DRAFT_301419 [Pyronema domesticum]|nr:hypothetical protein FPQ18DRAFT_301419 [Pyronema domesticum]
MTYPLPFCRKLRSPGKSEEEISEILRLAHERSLRTERFINDATGVSTGTTIMPNKEYGPGGGAHNSARQDFWTCLVSALFLAPITEFDSLGMDKVDPKNGQHHLVVWWSPEENRPGTMYDIFRVIHICNEGDIDDHIKSSMQTFLEWVAAEKTFQGCFILISCISRVALARVSKNSAGEIKVTYAGKSGQLDVVVLLSRAFIIQLCGMMEWLENRDIYPAKFTEPGHLEYLGLLQAQRQSLAPQVNSGRIASGPLPEGSNREHLRIIAARAADVWTEILVREQLKDDNL